MPVRRTPKISPRQTRSSRREYPTDDSDSESEFQDRHNYSSLSTSKTSISTTDKSVSDQSSLSYVEKSPRSSTSTPGSTPSRKLYPDISGLRSESDDSFQQNVRYESSEWQRVTPPPRQKQYFSRSPITKPLSKCSKIEPQDFPWIWILFFGALLIGAAFWFNWPSNEATVINDTKYETFIEEIKKLQVQFPKQDMRLWRSIIASSRHILKQPNSTFPSVIVLASQVKTPLLSFCIAEKIASRFLFSRGIELDHIPSTDIEHIKYLKAQDQKLSLDEDVQTAFKSPAGKAYVIRNLQLLSPQAALLLHGLCDGDNAPYKDVMILMTLEIVSNKEEMNVKDAEDYLVNLWTTQVEYDKVAAVMSRISNNLVILQQEDVSVIEQMCSDIERK